MFERLRRGSSPENQLSQSSQAPGFASELRASLDPRELLHNFATAPVCTIGDMARDLPTMAIILGGSWAIGRGIVYLHEKLGIPNPEALRPIDLLIFTVATLTLAGVSHYINRRLPGPFRH